MSLNWQFDFTKLPITQVESKEGYIVHDMGHWWGVIAPHGITKTWEGFDGLSNAMQFAETLNFRWLKQEEQQERVEEITVPYAFKPGQHDLLTEDPTGQDLIESSVPKFADKMACD